MKKLKLIWKDYADSGIASCKSLNESWENVTDTDVDADYDIYIDSLDIPDGACAFLCEPMSITRRQYNYALENRDRLKYIISFDTTFFNNVVNFIKIPPPLGSWIEEKDAFMHTKSKNISFIASTKEMCNEHTYRQEMVSKYKDFCDVYGRGRAGRSLGAKIDGVRDYRFSFCMENYITDMYYTEKVLDCFLTGTIPIYFGSRSICDIFDEKGIIWVEDINNKTVLIESLNEDFYNSKIDSIKKNYDIAKLLNNSMRNSLDFFIKMI